MSRNYRATTQTKGSIACHAQGCSSVCVSSASCSVPLDNGSPAEVRAQRHLVCPYRAGPGPSSGSISISPLAIAWIAACDIGPGSRRTRWAQYFRAIPLCRSRAEKIFDKLRNGVLVVFCTEAPGTRCIFMTRMCSRTNSVVRRRA